MLTTRISPIVARKQHGVFLVCGGLAMILFIMVIYSLQVGPEIAGQYAILADAAKEIRYEATHANLLVERRRMGENMGAFDELAQSRKRAETLNRILLSGGVYQGIKVPSFDDPQLIGLLHNVRSQQLEFYDFLEDYGGSILKESENGEVSRFTVMSSFQYDRLMASMIGVEERLETVIGARLTVFRVVQFVLIGVTLMCIVGAGLMLWGFIRRLENQNIQMAETENRSRLLLENARDMVVLVDVLTNKIVDVNAEACSVLGYEKKDLMDQTITVLEPNGELEKIDARSFTSEFNEKHSVDAMFADHAGHRFPVEVNLGFLRIKNRVYWLGVVRDVSGRKRMEQELMNAKLLAEAASRTKTQFLDNMSHEVRTPINGIMGTLQLLQDTVLSEEQQEYVDLGMQSCNSLGSLIGNILDLSSVDSSKSRMCRDSFVFEDLIWSIEDKFAHDLAAKNLYCEVKILHEIPKELVGDPRRIYQVLASLIGNAVKFTEEGGVRVTVRRIDDGRGQKVNFARIRIEIADTGPGIPEEQLQTIFKPFQQIDNSYTRKHQGAGLGLAVVERLVKKMDGDVFVSSEMQRGSTFVVELPLEIGEESGEDFLLEEPAPNPPVAGKKALVVEQDEVTRLGLIGILDRLGIQSMSASSSDEAKQILQSKSFDFALMDPAVLSANGLGIPVLEISKTRATKSIEKDDSGKDPLSASDEIRLMDYQDRIVKMFES